MQFSRLPIIAEVLCVYQWLLHQCVYVYVYVYVYAYAYVYVSECRGWLLLGCGTCVFRTSTSASVCLPPVFWWLWLCGLEWALGVVATGSCACGGFRGVRGGCCRWWVGWPQSSCFSCLWFLLTYKLLFAIVSALDIELLPLSNIFLHIPIQFIHDIVYLVKLHMVNK